MANVIISTWTFVAVLCLVNVALIEAFPLTGISMHDLAQHISDIQKDKLVNKLFAEVAKKPNQDEAFGLINQLFGNGEKISSTDGTGNNKKPLNAIKWDDLSNDVSNDQGQLPLDNSEFSSLEVSYEESDSLLESSASSTDDSYSFSEGSDGGATSRESSESEASSSESGDSVASDRSDVEIRTWLRGAMADGRRGTELNLN